MGIFFLIASYKKISHHHQASCSSIDAGFKKKLNKNRKNEIGKMDIIVQTPDVPEYAFPLE